MLAAAAAAVGLAIARMGKRPSDLSARARRERERGRGRWTEEELNGSVMLIDRPALAGVLWTTRLQKSFVCAIEWNYRVDCDGSWML